MKTLMTIDQVPQRPMDAYEVAEHLYGREAVNLNALLAGKAAEEMRKAGWKFVEYNDSGEEVHEPPKS